MMIHFIYRVLSPPPGNSAQQQLNTTNGTGNNLAIPNGNDVIKEEEEIGPHARENPPPPSANSQKINGAVIEENGKATNNSQSYLALTKLGMGKKDEPSSGSVAKQKETSVSGKEHNGTTKNSPKESKKANGERSKENGKQDNGKRKTMAEMATSTLKGFAKM